jgi:Tol biopolymer transport system component
VSGGLTALFTRFVLGCRYGTGLIPLFGSFEDITPHTSLIGPPLVYSPDGRTYAYESGSSTLGWNLIFSNACTGPRVPNANSYYLGTFSPDGTKIVFAVNGGPSDGPSLGIFVADVCGGGYNTIDLLHIRQRDEQRRR